MTENEISHLIIRKAIEIHKNLGIGLLESAYKECLCYELRQAGLQVEKEKPMPLIYKEIHLEYGYRLDLLVEKKVVVEIKSVDYVVDVHKAQTLTYMKLGGYPLGLLINLKRLF